MISCGLRDAYARVVRRFAGSHFAPARLELDHGASILRLRVAPLRFPRMSIHQLERGRQTPVAAASARRR
jgi:hypothetical protein